jgi:glycosyltransferase involved in cell wall biosynthesis
MSSDIYMMPSLRDNCPATLLEAMLCRCVPFVVDCNGPGEMVPGNAGIKIEPAAPESMAELFAAELVRLAANRLALRQLAEAAAAHVRASFTESRYVQTVTTAYNQATSRKI